MSKKLYLEFEGFNETIKRLNKLEGDIKKTTEKALEKTHEIVTKKSNEAIQPHNKTTETQKSLYKEGKIKWNGSIADVDVGFSIRKGRTCFYFFNVWNT